MKAKVITDWGFVPKCIDPDTGENIGWRYLVWGFTGRKDEVIDGGNNLRTLRKKYPGLKVVLLKS